jgi:peptide chain release factor 2
MTDELQLAYEFHKEGELTAEELDEQYALIENHIDAIEFKNMLSDEGDTLSCITNNSGSRWNRKLRLGRNAHMRI